MTRREWSWCHAAGTFASSPARASSAKARSRAEKEKSMGRRLTTRGGGGPTRRPGRPHGASRGRVALSGRPVLTSRSRAETRRTLTEPLSIWNWGQR